LEQQDILNSMATANVQRRVTLREECHQSRMHGEERQTTDVLADDALLCTCLEATS
jgi:hypothetical protein